MAISPVCDKCGKELTGYGGLLFGPPDSDGMSRKTHLCRDCYDAIVDSF